MSQYCEFTKLNKLADVEYYITELEKTVGGVKTVAECLRNDIRGLRRNLEYHKKCGGLVPADIQKYQIVLQTEHAWLLQSLYPDVVADYLYSWAILDGEQLNAITTKKLIRQEQCRVLLNIIKGKPLTCFEYFLTALEKTDQVFIVEHLKKCMGK